VRWIGKRQRNMVVCVLLGIWILRFRALLPSPHHFLVVSYSNCATTPTLHNLKSRTPCVPYLCMEGSYMIWRLGSVCWRLVRSYCARSHMVCRMPYLGVFWWFLFIVVLSLLCRNECSLRKVTL
jgi:hypothetical protein